jgi:uncharacterized protein (TIGR03083 family)
MDVSDIYTACRTRLVDLAPTLTTDQLDQPLAATPPWTVLDGYRHLTGVCVDVVDGNLDNAGSPEWTAAQLHGRSDKSIDDVLDEWRARGPELDARVEHAGNAMAFVAFDAWTHGQDIRAAVGEPRADDELAAPLAELALDTFAPRYAKSGAPAVRVVVDGNERVLGAGEPAVTLDTSAYEFLRIVFGRRSTAQLEAAGWSGAGDPAPVIAAIHLFDPPPVDIAD